MAKVVRDASERANGLVDALLVLARSEAQAGRRLARKVPADLATGVGSGAVRGARARPSGSKLDVEHRPASRRRWSATRACWTGSPAT